MYIKEFVVLSKREGVKEENTITRNPHWIQAHWSTKSILSSCCWGDHSNTLQLSFCITASQSRIQPRMENWILTHSALIIFLYIYFFPFYYLIYAWNNRLGTPTPQVRSDRNPGRNHLPMGSAVCCPSQILRVKQNYYPLALTTLHGIVGRIVREVRKERYSSLLPLNDQGVIVIVPSKALCAPLPLHLHSRSMLQHSHSDTKLGVEMKIGEINQKVRPPTEMKWNVLLDG